MHSAKGSEWTKHQYVKKIDGVYYYPVGYDKGRTIDTTPGSSKTKKKVQNKKDSKNTKNDDKSKKSSKNSKDVKNSKDTKGKLSKKEVKKLASEVISGKYGVGTDRQKALGKKYNRVQHRVNVMLLGKDRAIQIRDRKRTTRSAMKSSSSKKK